MEKSHIKNVMFEIKKYSIAHENIIACGKKYRAQNIRPCMDGWVCGKAGLRIAYSNQKIWIQIEMGQQNLVQILNWTELGQRDLTSELIWMVRFNLWALITQAY